MDMIYFKDNPNLDRKTVVTKTGETEYRVNCKKIKGAYYTINKDCFLLEGLWYRKNSGLIEFDYETGQWFLIKKMTHDMIKGVVGINKDGSGIFGHFSPNVFNNCNVCVNGKMGGHTAIALNTEILRQNGYAEDFSTGVWYNTKLVPINQLQLIKNVLNHTGKGYNIEDNGAEYEAKREAYDRYNPELSKDVRAYGKMLGDTSWGIEIECAKGYMPDNLQYRNGIVVCRDGSLNDENGKPGPEFVSIPLKGAKGLQTTVNMANDLAIRTDIDIKCSLHIHLGNIPKEKLFLVAIYRLATKIQNELFQMFPYYKANPEGIKGKNYNQKLPLQGIYNAEKGMTKKEFNEYIDRAFRIIFTWLSEGVQPDKNWNRKIHKHPIPQKWNRHKRYYWLNIMNTIFSERNTVEFRLHTPTTNSQKIVNWLFICNAIVKYAQNNYDRILMSRQGAIKMKDVLNYYALNFGKRGQFLSEYLIAYMESRKELFFKDYQNNDFVSGWEMAKDKEYEFKYGNVTHLF